MGKIKEHPAYKHQPLFFPPFSINREQVLEPVPFSPRIYQRDGGSQRLPLWHAHWCHQSAYKRQTKTYNFWFQHFRFGANLSVVKILRTWCLNQNGTGSLLVEKSYFLEIFSPKCFTENIWVKCFVWMYNITLNIKTYFVVEVKGFGFEEGFIFFLLRDWD